MASTNKCEYCGSTITSEDKICPKCGAPNPLYVEDKPRVILTPHTIEELQEYCAERGMPLLRMRFFIGENYLEPKAFGIFYDERTKEYVVYKNKANGERAIRYRGDNEEYAVSEVYLKLLDECHKRGIYPDTPDGKPPKDYTKDRKSERPKITKESIANKLNEVGGSALIVLGMFILGGLFLLLEMGISYVFHLITINIFLAAIVMIILFIVGYILFIKKRTGSEKKFAFAIYGVIYAIILCIVIGITWGNYKHPRGYYVDSNKLYYHIGSSWYYSDDIGYWHPTTNVEYDRDNYVGDSWNSEWGDTAYSFTNSSAYSAYQDSHSSESDSSSGYDSWDSSDTDWDSDW